MAMLVYQRVKHLQNPSSPGQHQHDAPLESQHQPGRLGEPLRGRAAAARLVGPMEHVCFKYMVYIWCMSIYIYVCV
jgi:hypothetical protein